MKSGVLGQKLIVMGAALPILRE